MAMTTANKVTFLRILLVPIFIYEVLEYREQGDESNRWLSLISFALAAVLDGVDGFIARRFHQKSELGALLDPLADKLLLVAGLILLSMTNSYLQRIPLWLVSVTLSRDVLLLIGVVLIHLQCGKVTVRPHWTGKIATFLQMAVVLWTLLKLDHRIQLWIALGATVLTAVSGIRYLLDAINQLGESPKSSSTPGQ